MMAHERTLEVSDRTVLQQLVGPADQHLRRVREAFRVRTILRGARLRVLGEPAPVHAALEALNRMLRRIETTGTLVESDVDGVLAGGAAAAAEAAPRGRGRPGGRGAPITVVRTVEPVSPGQRTYWEAMVAHPLVFSIGPAGTGKTLLAVARAVAALRANEVRKIVLTRPAVEAGERLGFLPGDFQAKVNPYLRPIYDALNSLLEFGQLRRLLDTEIIEICPLAYMRGRTLDQAFIILDEGQNTTPDQMKMFLTRMGQDSRIVVTGDITQMDIPAGRTSGLVDVQSILSGVPGIGFTYLTKADIVRHPLVQKIVEAYEKHAP